MRSERANLASRDSAAVLYFADDFFHPGYCRSGEGVAVELHLQLTASRVADRDGFSVLRGAPKKEFPQPVGQLLFLGNSRSQEKCAGPIAKEPSKLASRAPRPQRSAMHVGGRHQHSLSAPGRKERLCHSQGLQQAQATTAHIKGIAVFPQTQFGVKDRRERRIGVVSFAGRQNPVYVFRLFTGILESSPAGLSPERTLIFVFGYMGERENARTTLQLSRGHPEGLVHFLRGDHTRPKCAGGSDNVDAGSQAQTPFSPDREPEALQSVRPIQSNTIHHPADTPAFPVRHGKLNTLCSTRNILWPREKCGTHTAPIEGPGHPRGRPGGLGQTESYWLRPQNRATAASDPPHHRGFRALPRV